MGSWTRYSTIVLIMQVVDLLINLPWARVLQ
jgi:hypothetical protein